ncbi:Cytochrome P450 89A2 [Ananas comosus]|uniref:Cytochrome P450 89A2 n=1 Tax=Ananas comosus TaxID=4615 RepID=A0A199VEN6_ANACO|nr:Cytochrome P450 89A2 [Ananas comosus]
MANNDIYRIPPPRRRRLRPNKKRKLPLPPGPAAVPILGNLLWLRHSFSLQNIEPLLRELHSRYGPILTSASAPSRRLRRRPRPRHRALVELGAAFSDRPVPPAARFISADSHVVSSAAYGPLWRLLRRNLVAEILHPSHLRLYAPGRRWVLRLLSDDLRSQSRSSDGGPVAVMPSFQFAMFALLVLMCFGEKLDHESIKQIEIAQRSFLLYVVSNLSVLGILPQITKHIFRNRLKTATALRARQRELFVPLIRAREEFKRKKQQQQQQRRQQNGDQVQEDEERFVYSYVDSLLDMEIPEEGGRKLSEEEMVALCSEFLNAGTDTTSTALQWIMANLVKHRDVQRKLAEEIDRVAAGNAEEDAIREEDLQKMPYLKAVVLEGLRRHPPGHFVLPHAVTEETEITGYRIPKEAAVNFLVAEMGRDGRVWEAPMEFRPERFMEGGDGEGVDAAGVCKGVIKMMPFGAGRRMCPGLGLALLHLECFVAHLVREFEWLPAAEGEEVDLAEKPEFTIVMKNPLRARLVPRSRHAA